ncbi:MAG: sodium-translocating pyrophosphatase [Arenicellales bacterium]
MSWGIWIGLAGGGVGLVYAVLTGIWVLRQDRGQAALQTPYVAIREGAVAFLETQYLAILGVGAILAVILWLSPGFGWLTAAGFALGGICSAAAGAAGMFVSTGANVRTTAAASGGLAPALRVAIRAGSVTGFLVGALALASVAGFYLLLRFSSASPEVDLRPLIGLGFGASLISIFARLGGGIFTKAADVGADLVGKIEHGIPEDDPRNPATIADNVGDNVGDCAGMAADLFESYVVTVISTMLVASWVLPEVTAARFFPLAIGGVTLCAAVAGVQAMRPPSGQGVMGAFLRGVVVTVVLAAAGIIAVGVLLLGGEPTIKLGPLLGAGLAGIVVAAGLAGMTVYYTGVRFEPVRHVANASSAGHATNIIAGLALSMKSAAVPVLFVAAGVVAAYGLAGLYGLAVATTTMLALTPVVVTVDAFGPVTDNAGGIAEMAGISASVREITDVLDAAGNTTKAVTKAFAIGSAGLAALVLFAAYEVELRRVGYGLEFTLDSPYVIAGLLIGGVLPSLFAGYAMEAVGKAASGIVAYVRDQFSRYPEILDGKRLPDYAETVSSLTRTSIREMLLPGLIPVVAPLAVGLLWPIFGPAGTAAQVIGGMLIGGIVTGLLLAISLCTGGAAWDNAKKYIEAGHVGGKGSAAHHAAVTGDTVGDPYKDTAGPAINPMIKILNLVALLIVPYLT